MPQHDKVLLTVVLAHATTIFLKGQIEYPMQTILVVGKRDRSLLPAFRTGHESFPLIRLLSEMARVRSTPCMLLCMTLIVAMPM